MKRLYTTLLLTSMAAASMAQLNGDGFYRLKNYKSERYAYIIDNHAKIDLVATDADMKAVQLWMGFEKAASDPATIIYIKSLGGTSYDIQGQGTGLQQMMGYSLTVKPSSNNDGTYLASATAYGTTIYLGDVEQALALDGTLAYEDGALGGTSGDWRKWYILPVTATGDNYFGVKPEIAIGDKYYATMYASFPFTCASEGMKVYTVARTTEGLAQYEEVTGVVPGGTPVVFECSSDDPSNNRLNIQESSASAPAQNELGGVYFFTKYTSSANFHYNRTAYDPQTMRLLGQLSDGSIGFVKSSDTKWLPANKAYLKVDADAPDEIRLVDADTYNKTLTPEEPETPTDPEEPETPETPETPTDPDVPETPETPETPTEPETPETPTEPETPSAITTITTDQPTVVDIYTLSGLRVRNITVPGLYIVNGKKAVVR